MNNQTLVRLLIFSLCFFSLAILENFFPDRKQSEKKVKRWSVNFTLVSLDLILLKVLFPIGLVGFAVYVHDKNFGLLNYFHVDGLRYDVACLLLFDLIIYGQHYFFHKLNWLWSFHQVHHSDGDLDVTSGVRFHPVEIIISSIIKIIFIFIIGPSYKSVFFFEVLLNSSSLFNHANLFIPPSIEKKLRLLIVTPQMHIIHHSNNDTAKSKNFGFNLSWWDYVFMTYKDINFSNYIIGLERYGPTKRQKIFRLLSIPFNSKFQ